MSWTEIAVDMARLIAHQHGCELESFSLDGADVEEEHGVEVIRIHASAMFRPLRDDIPWDDEILFEASVAERAQ